MTLLVPALYPVFKTHAMTAAQWGLVVALAFLPIPCVEALKVVVRARARRRGA